MASGTVSPEKARWPVSDAMTEWVVAVEAAGAREREVDREWVRRRWEAAARMRRDEWRQLIARYGREAVEAVVRHAGGVVPDLDEKE